MVAKSKVKTAAGCNAVQITIQDCAAREADNAVVRAWMKLEVNEAANRGQMGVYRVRKQYDGLLS